MSIVELIGLIVSLISLIFIYFKQRYDQRYRQEHPDEFKDEDFLSEEDPLAGLIKAVGKEKNMKAQPMPPLPPKVIKQSKKTPIPLQDYRLKSDIENRRLKSSLENRQVKTNLTQRREELLHHSVSSSLHYTENRQEERLSKAREAIQRLSQRRDLLIYQEIMDKPKSLRP